MNVEEERRSDDGELEHDQPQRPRDQEPGQVSAAAALLETQIRARAGEQHERGRAEVGDPPRHEDGGGRPGEILRLERHRRRMHVVARVVEGHDDHHDAAQDVQRLNTDAVPPIGDANRDRTGHGDRREAGRGGHRVLERFGENMRMNSTCRHYP
jgi:hypothetical protein